MSDVGESGWLRPGSRLIGKYEIVRTRAAAFEGGPDQHWAYFKDAEGNLFEIVERPPAR